MTATGIVNVLKNNLQNDKYSVHLSPHDIKYVDTLLESNPEMFNQIHSMVDEIISDGVLDIHDIPKIVLLISKIYKTNLIGEFIKKVKILSVIRFTVDSLLDSGLVPLPEIEIIIIKKIVDVSIDLLSTNVHRIEEETKTCWQGVVNLFTTNHGGGKATGGVWKGAECHRTTNFKGSAKQLGTREAGTKCFAPGEVWAWFKHLFCSCHTDSAVSSPCVSKQKCNCDCTKCENVIDPVCKCDENCKCFPKCNCTEKCNCSKLIRV